MAPDRTDLRRIDETRFTMDDWGEPRWDDGGMARAVQVQTSIDDPARAQEIAAELVDVRLAACVQVLGPMTSTYRWDGEVEQATEHLLLCKTSVDRADALVEALRDLHPYAVPEVVVLPIDGGLAAYLDWIDDAVS